MTELLDSATKEYLMRKCTCKSCGGMLTVANYSKRGTGGVHKGKCQFTNRINLK